MADANVLIAAFLKDSTTRRIITLAELQLLVPEFIFEEFERHRRELARRAGLAPSDAERLLKTIRNHFVVIPADLIAERIAEAIRILKGIDERDAPYLAAALAVPCDAIWSDDPHLKLQRLVPCLTTRELVEILRKSGVRLQDGMRNPKGGLSPPAARRRGRPESSPGGPRTARRGPSPASGSTSRGS